MEETKKQKTKRFIDEYSFKDRVEKALKQRQSKPSNIPLIVERHPKSSLPDLQKCRYSCDQNSKFILLHKMIEDLITKAVEEKTQGKQTLRKDGKSSFFLYVANNIPNADQVMLDVYQKYKNEDGFLYLLYGEMEKF